MNLVRHRVASICLGAVVAVGHAAGCGDDDQGDDTATGVGGTSEGTDAMTAGSASQTTTNSTTPGTSDPTAPSTDPTMGSMSGSGADTSGADTGTMSCEPEASDDECSVCTKASCCDQLGACFASTECTCMTGCATGLDSIAMCTKKCGTSTEFSGLTQCVTVNCAPDCI